MSIEGSKIQESFKPKFTIWVSKDTMPIPQKKLLASHGETTFEITYNYNNYTFVGDIRMISNTRERSSQELNALRKYAKEAFEVHIDDLKLKDYSENFK